MTAMCIDDDVDNGRIVYSGMCSGEIFLGANISDLQSQIPHFFMWIIHPSVPIVVGLIAKMSENARSQSGRQCSHVFLKCHIDHQPYFSLFKQSKDYMNIHHKYGDIMKMHNTHYGRIGQTLKTNDSITPPPPITWLDAHRVCPYPGGQILFIPDAFEPFELPLRYWLVL